MNPGHAKLLLLVFLMFGIGGYVFYSTLPPPASDHAEESTQPLMKKVPPFRAMNVRNVHLELQGATTTVTGVAKEALNGTVASLRVTGTTFAGAFEGRFEHVTADLFVDMRLVKGGSIVVDLGSFATGNKAVDEELRSERILDVTRFPQAVFLITQLAKDDEGGMRMVGNLTWRGIMQELRVSYARVGKELRGQTTIDLASFGIGSPTIKDHAVQLSFVLGVK